VIASRIGGLPYTVTDGVTGLLCEPGDPVTSPGKSPGCWMIPRSDARWG
jgi:hypothetical protein